MSLRPADLRFLVGHPVGTVTVLPTEKGAWSASLESALAESGADVRPPGTSEVDLVIADAAAAPRALSLPASTHVIDGHVARALLRGSGRSATKLMTIRHQGQLATVVPVQDRRALLHYLREMASPDGLPERAAKRGLQAFAGVGVHVAPLLPSSRLLTVVQGAGDRFQRRPRLLQLAAADAGVSADSSWVLSLGRGDDLQRAVFHLVEDDGPVHVVKFARHPAARGAFDRDAEGLAHARDAGDIVARHAPRLVARFEMDGLPASVESAARGRGLHLMLDRRALPLVEEIASWIVQTGEQTSVTPSALEPELRRLQGEVLPSWPQADAGSLIAAVSSVPGVLQHNDLGTWNIIVDPSAGTTGFTVVDWESARAVGLPLWDLVYFLGDVLPRLEGPADVATLRQRCIDLFHGRSSYSPTLFRWLHEAVGRLGLPRAAVGALVTLCWLHHGMSAGRRRVALAGAAAAPDGHLGLMAEAWLSEPALGPAWAAWLG